MFLTTRLSPNVSQHITYINYRTGLYSYGRSYDLNYTGE